MGIGERELGERPRAGDVGGVPLGGERDGVGGGSRGVAFRVTFGAAGPCRRCDGGATRGVEDSEPEGRGGLVAGRFGWFAIGLPGTPPLGGVGTRARDSPAERAPPGEGLPSTRCRSTLACRYERATFSRWIRSVSLTFVRRIVSLR